MTPARVCVVGSANLDLVVRVERAPEAGETVTGRTVTSSPGGKGANQAVAAVRAGGTVVFVGAVGDDDPGRRLRAHYEAEGVDVSCLRSVAGVATGTAVVTVDDTGENRIVVVPGANGELTSLDDAARAAVTGSDVVLLQLEVPLSVVDETARLAREHGVRVVLTPAPAVPLRDELLAAVDLLLPNRHEARLLTGADDPVTAARRLRERGVGEVVVTLGDAGALHLGADGEVHTEPARPAEVVDTTGAGDAFAGCLAVALAEGRPMPEALRRASIAGALAVARPGAAAPTRDEVEAALADPS